VDQDLLEHFLSDDSRRGPLSGGVLGEAGGHVCGDVVRIGLGVERGTVRTARWEAEGCATTLAAAAASCELTEGSSVLGAGRIGATDVAAALGGLSPGKHHSAAIAADALHRALSDLAASDAVLAEPAAERILVAMSGGVDSAVAALLEQRAGREVVGVTLKLWSDQRTDGGQSCCSPEALLSARALAHSLGLPHLSLDLEPDFRSEVVSDFLTGYDAGRTPNPCIRCNGSLRIAAMVDLADRVGAVALVTGHYARIVEDDEGPLLAAARDANKDQAYMLSALPPALLGRVRFPLAEMTKPEVRQIASDAGLEVAGKPESQDLCFLAGEGKEAFLQRHAGVPERTGEIVDRLGRVLGRHSGHRRFTVGQRRGLGVSGREPLYVLAKNAPANRVTVGPREELEVHRVRLRRPVLHRDPARVNRVKLRYRAAPLRCRLDGVAHDQATLVLDSAAEAVAPGQTACLMDGDSVVGWGVVAAAAR
jgi:tRNA-uridine 2-sulfurtransferase